MQYEVIDKIKVFVHAHTLTRHKGYDISSPDIPPVSLKSSSINWVITFKSEEIQISDVNSFVTLTWYQIGTPPPPFMKAGDIKLNRLSVCLSVHMSKVSMVEHLYLACIIIVTSPFYWYHDVTLTFGLSEGQICCKVRDHNSLNFNL